jgi:hypothetical protein
MKTSKMRLFLTLIMALMVGTLTSEAAFAAGGGYGGWRGGGGWHGGGLGNGSHGSSLVNGWLRGVQSREQRNQNDDRDGYA